MKTSTIIKFSILFFLAAFVCAVVLKKLTTSKDETPTVTPTHTATSKNTTNKTPTIPLPKNNAIQKVDQSPEAMLDDMDTFSAELANSWEDSKRVEYTAKIETALSYTKLDDQDKADFLMLINKESELANVNPLLTYILIKLSSDFQKNLVQSKKIGLLQITDEEAQIISDKKKIKYLGKVTLGHPKVNTRLGLAKFRKMLEFNKFDLKKTLIDFSDPKDPKEYIKQVTNLIKSNFTKK